jgi:hypothetical protein
VCCREARTTLHRIRSACFAAVKYPKSFDFDANPSLNGKLALDPARCDFPARREKFIMLEACTCHVALEAFNYCFLLKHVTAMLHNDQFFAMTPSAPAALGNPRRLRHRTGSLPVRREYPLRRRGHASLPL